MANIIPLAGLGLRFIEEGYDLPKPLIPVSGVPMIVQVIRHAPPSDKWIFIVRQEHITNYKIDEIIKSEVPNAIIIAINQTTLGYANSCLLAQAYLDPEESLFISVCDGINMYDKIKYQHLIDDLKIDCIVWTFTQLEKMKINPHFYGWVKLASDNQTITNVSIKVPVSNNPYNDHATTGVFYFRKAKDFIYTTGLMIEEKDVRKNEFYVDLVPLYLSRLNKKSVIFDVNQFISWGTPQEMREYKYWESVLKDNEFSNEKEYNHKQYLFWKKYFDTENIINNR